MKRTIPSSSTSLLALRSSMRIAAAIRIPGVSGTPVAGIEGDFAPTGPVGVDPSQGRPGAWDSAPADVNLPFNGSRPVVIEPRNFPAMGAVTLFLVPPSGDRSELKTVLAAGSTSTQDTWNAPLEGALSARGALQVRAARE